MFTLAVSPFIVGLLVVLFVVVSIMMMLVVLIQRPQGGGLSEAFGASSGSNTTAFGAKTGDALTTATIVIFLLFIGFAIGLNYMVRPPAQVVAQPQEMSADDSQPITAQSIDPETGEPVAPIQLERIPAPEGFDRPATPPAEDGDFIVPPQEETSTPSPAPAPEPAPVPAEEEPQQQ